MLGTIEQVNKKKEVIQALEDKHGIVTEACKSIGFSRSTFYDWVNTDPEFKLAVEDITETAIDYVEGKLFEKITGVKVQTSGTGEDGESNVYQQPPSDTAIIFFLKTKAKKRGYIEKSEVGFTDGDGKDVSPVQIIQLPDNNR